MGSKLNTTAKEGDNLSPSFRLVGIRCDVVILNRLPRPLPLIWLVSVVRREPRKISQVSIGATLNQQLRTHGLVLALPWFRAERMDDRLPRQIPGS